MPGDTALPPPMSHDEDDDNDEDDDDDDRMVFLPETLSLTVVPELPATKANFVSSRNVLAPTVEVRIDPASGLQHHQSHHESSTTSPASPVPHIDINFLITQGPNIFRYLMTTHFPLEQALNQCTPVSATAAAR